MVFFDLNIPYLERDGSTATASQEPAGAASKAQRLKAVVRAMELGYTGVAYNRTIRGVVSDADRCKIPPFPLSSLVKVAPAIAAAASFHRELLGVPLSSPFRQYTRLTVAVDSALATAALNPGNAVLRTYHLVAVRPLNQAAFDQACKASEVDLISIDFSQKLPFRLKLPMVKAAIERGVYFEITYSHLISDIHTRRQMLSNAKLLVDWTRGKNLIFSSGASSVNELRGPYDVVNLSSLLGLSVERAKVAISRNCRSLLTNALRRKQCYKEAIRVEKILPSKCLDAQDPWFVDWTNWDPISSGEGDLPALDNISRIFSSSGQASKNYCEINFGTVSNGKLFNRISNNGGDLVSLDDRAPCSDDLEVVIEDEKMLPATPLERLLSDNEGDLAPPPGSGKLLPNDESFEPIVAENEVPSSVSNFDVVDAADEGPLSANPSNTCGAANEIELISLDDSVKLFTVPDNAVPSDLCVSEIKSSRRPDSVPVVLDTPEDATSLRDFISSVKNEVSPAETEGPLDNLMEIYPSFATKGARSLSELVSAHNAPGVQVLARVNKLERDDPFMSVEDILFQKDFIKSRMTGEDDSVLSPDGTRPNEASDTEMQNQNQKDVVSVADGMLSKEMPVNMEQYGEVSAATICSQQKERKPGKVKFKQQLRHRGLPFISKHFIHRLPFKKSLVRRKHNGKF